MYRGINVDIEKIESFNSIDEKIFYCKSQILKYNDYHLLAGRILIDDLKKNIPRKFSEAMLNAEVLLDSTFLNYIINNKNDLDNIIDDEYDYSLSYIKVKSFIRTYLMSINDKIVEIPSQLYLRMAIYLYMDHPNALHLIKETYNELSSQLYCHATPTMINTGLKKPQLASCFLISNEDDLVNIGDNVKNTMIISKLQGGIGKDYSELRHSEINYNAPGIGLKGWAKIDDSVISVVNQGGKRNGSCAVYCDVFHIDIVQLLHCIRKDIGDSTTKTHNLFYGIMIHNMFMERVKNKQDCILFCPNKAKGLFKLYGNEFEKKYNEYEQLFYDEKIPGVKISATELYKEIIQCIALNGFPYILNKDEINEKSNQKNLGTIMTSNLCAEIVEYTDKDNIASCNLASVCLDKCVNDKKEIDFSLLERCVRKLVRNTNICIDKMYYPTEIPQIKNSNLNNRPIGIGVQGLADVFYMLGVSWISEEIYKINNDIFETIYYSAVDESNKISIELFKKGEKEYTYKTFKDSPLSEGLFQFDLWQQPINVWKYPPRYDWENLRLRVKEYGVYNSLLVALMPTASVRLTTGANESFTPFTGLCYNEDILSGNFLHINPHLINKLQELNMWNMKTIDEIIKHDSLKTIDCSQEIKDLFLTAYEIPKIIPIKLSEERGKFVCQTQSLNHYINLSPDENISNIIGSIINKGYIYKLKTISYYIRTKTNVKSISLSNIASDNICKSCQ